MDPDDRLARAVRELFRDGFRSRRGMCRPHARRVIDSDPELSAFLASVERGGDDAWEEEYSRIRRRQRQQREELGLRDDGLGGTPSLSSTAIIALLPTWRAWGRMLLEHQAGG